MQSPWTSRIVEVAADVAVETGRVINYSGHLSAPTGKYQDQNSVLWTSQHMSLMGTANLIPNRYRMG